MRKTIFSNSALPIVALALTGTVMGTSQSAAIAQSSALCPAQVQTELSRVLNSSAAPRSRWSILIQTQGAAGNRRNLFAHNPATQLVPASNNKLFTTAAALVKLGANYRIRTTVSGAAIAPALASLRIIGRGDPSLTTAQLTNLAQQLSQKGIRQVDLLIGDDTYFQGATVNPNWDADDALAGYGAPVNSLILNQNAIGLTLFPQRVGQPLRVQWDDPLDAQTWRVDNRSTTVSASGSEFIDAVRDPNQWIVRVTGQLRAGSASEPVAASIPNPGNYLVQRFRTVLTSAQIPVARSTLVRQSPAPVGEVELAAVESPPLSQLLIETNRESNNVFAEALLKAIGKAQTPNNTDATVAGAAAVKTILTPLGVNPNRYSMVDGSGLASRNRASAEAFVQTLQAMAQIPDAPVYRNSLAIAGVNGTLKNRFRNTAAQGRLFGKTGTIGGVVSLSGYLTPPNYSPIVFSFLVNDGASASTLRSEMDRMVVLLTRLRSCQ